MIFPTTVQCFSHLKRILSGHYAALTI